MEGYYFNTGAGIALDYNFADLFRAGGPCFCPTNVRTTLKADTQNYVDIPLQYGGRTIGRVTAMWEDASAWADLATMQGYGVYNPYVCWPNPGLRNSYLWSAPNDKGLRTPYKDTLGAASTQYASSCIDYVNIQLYNPEYGYPDEYAGFLADAEAQKAAVLEAWAACPNVRYIQSAAVSRGVANLYKLGGRYCGQIVSEPYQRDYWTIYNNPLKRLFDNPIGMTPVFSTAGPAASNQLIMTAKSNTRTVNRVLNLNIDVEGPFGYFNWVKFDEPVSTTPPGLRVNLISNPGKQYFSFAHAPAHVGQFTGSPDRLLPLWGPTGSNGTMLSYQYNWTRDMITADPKTQPDEYSGRYGYACYPPNITDVTALANPSGCAPADAWDGSYITYREDGAADGKITNLVAWRYHFGARRLT